MTDHARRWDWPAALLLVVIVACALRWGTHVLDKGLLFDERYITVPIQALISDGWSVTRAIDFQETKGPTLIWSYAILGGALGGELNDLRLVSVGLFVLGVIPLLLIARWCHLKGAAFVWVALLYVLLPYQALVGQLVMSETSFVFGALWLAWIFCWGFSDERRTAHMVAGPVLFGIVLTLLLHNRIHAVAFAAAAVLVATQRDGRGSWPWWLAALLAGLLRLPLWIRWGGPVSPSYQDLFQTGLDLENLTYLAAAFVAFTGLLIVAVARPGVARSTIGLLIGGAVVGLILGLLVPVTLADTLTFQEVVHRRYLGIVVTVVGQPPPTGAQNLVIALLAAIGLASMGALAGLSLQRPANDRAGVVMRLTFWSLFTGWALYSLNRGFVFDRYLMPWATLLPVVLVVCLRRPTLVLQALLWLGIGAYMIGKRLIW
jgi:hypothetical protein